MRSFILLALFLLISSKTNDIDYYKEINFDKDTKEFKFILSKTGMVFFHVVYDGSSQVEFKISNDEETSVSKSSFTKPGHSYITSLSKGITYTLTITCPSGSKGTFIMNPEWNEVNVDLSKMYQWKFDISGLTGDESAKLIYSIDNADKDVTFKFEYNKKLRDDLPNPFEVCHGEDCKDNIANYKFEKGQSYKIYVKVAKLKDGIMEKYYLPSFKFGDLNGDWSFSFNLRTNIWIISLGLLLIL